MVGVCDEQSPKIAVALAGDFNSCPCIAPYNYVVMGSFRKEDLEWMSYRSTEVAACGCLGDLGLLSLEYEEEKFTRRLGLPAFALQRKRRRFGLRRCWRGAMRVSKKTSLKKRGDERGTTCEPREES